MPSLGCNTYNLTLYVYDLILGDLCHSLSWDHHLRILKMQWHPTPVLLPGKFHGRRSLVGCSPWGRKESGTTEWLHFHFSLSCIGEGNGNPLQSSCLENPRDGGAWWAAVYGVAQSWTRLKLLSSSSSSSNRFSVSLTKGLWSWPASCLPRPLNPSCFYFPIYRMRCCLKSFTALKFYQLQIIWALA